MVSTAPRFAATLGATMLALSVLASDAPAPGASAHILVQGSPLAGFRHHEARNVWGDIRAGDALTLAREPENPHDPNAVRVEWRGRKLGYVPRAENEAVARQMDRGARLEARVSRLNRTRAPNRRIEFEILVPL